MKAKLTLLAQLPAVVLLAVVTAWLLQGAIERIPYPYDIEWMEGGMLVHVWRLRHGLGLYVKPSPDFIPYIYPPFYPWLLSLLGEPSYALGRGVSLFGTFAAAAAAAFAVRGEGVRWGIALGAAGLYLSCYPLSGSFYDLVRADALAIGFASWALVLARRGSRKAVIGAGLLLVLAWITKHNYAAFGLPMAGWLWATQGRRRAIEFGLASALPAAVITLALQVATDGYFLTYLIGVPGTHPLVAERAWPLSEIELATCLLWTNVGGLAALLAFAGMKRFGRGAAYWGPVLAVAAGLCILMRAHIGGFTNVLMPGHWALAVCGTAALGALARRFEHPLSVLAVSALLAWQVWLGRWDVEKGLPTEADFAAGELLIEELRGIEGEVWSPHFAWYPVMAGKEPSLPLIALWDIDHKDGPLYEDVKGIDRAVCDHHWAAILTAGDRKDLKHGVKRCYERGPRLPIKGNGLSTKTGWRVRPTYIWTPIEPGSGTEDEAPPEDDEETTEEIPSEE